MKAARVGVALAGLAVGAMVAMRQRTPRDFDLAGKAALVTGGSRGLGFAIARELAREGCKVAIVARDRDELERAQAALEAEGGQVLALACDVADEERVKEVINNVITHFGGLDLLVNNAGVIQVGPISTMTQSDFKLCLDVMFWGVVNPTLAALPHMRSREGGRIVNITSIGGKISAPHVLPYGAAKFAAVAFSEGLRAELAKDRIRVTTVVPGLMRTGSHLNAFFKGEQEKEFIWFAISDTLPFLSMDAERAARRIVLAAKRGEAELILTLPAKLGVRINGLFPGLTSDLLGIVNRLLPSRQGGHLDSARGLELQERIGSRLLERVTALGIDAARRFGELPPSGNGRPA